MFGLLVIIMLLIGSLMIVLFILAKPEESVLRDKDDPNQEGQPSTPNKPETGKAAQTTDKAPLKDPEITFNVDAMISTLRNADLPEREKAAEALGQIKDARSVDSLIEALRDDNVLVKEKAAWALGELQDERAIQPLISLLQGEVREHAAWALFRIGRAAVESLAATLGDAQESVRQEAKRILDLIDNPQSVEALLLSSQKGNWETRKNAVWAMREKNDPRIVAALVESIKDSYPEVRIKAIEALGTLKEKTAVKPLIEALADAETRTSACWALGEIKDAESIVPLVELLGDSKPTALEHAIMALNKIGSPAVEALLVALKSENGQVRENAAWALGEIKDARAVEPLMHSLKEENMLVRVKAAEALGSIRDRRAVEPLIQAINDANTLVKVKAVEALGQIRDARAVKPLIGLLKNENPFVVENTALALGNLHDAHAVEALVGLLKSSSGDAVMKALTQLTGETHPGKTAWQEWWEQNGRNFIMRLSD